jgi:hypothetical protein
LIQRWHKKVHPPQGTGRALDEHYAGGITLLSCTDSSAQADGL